MDLSLLVPIHNNLAYTKFFYSTTRELYPEIELVFVSGGSTDGTHAWLDGLQDPFLKYHYFQEEKSIAYKYNKCIELASKKYVAFLHNDMVLAPGFAEHFLQDIAKQQLLVYRVVEPPVFAADKHDWKLTADFGSGIEDFSIAGFYSYVAQLGLREPYATEDLIFFFGVEKSALTHIGGLDPLFDPMFREDDDLLFRLRLLGLGAYQSYNAIVYHFVSKTSRFSEQFAATTQLIEARSHRNFYRKWSFNPHAKVKEKRNYGLVLSHTNDELLQVLEPLVDHIYTDGEINNYLTRTQPETRINLSEKFVSRNQLPTDDIVIYLKSAGISPKDLRIMENLAGQIQKIIQHPWYWLKKILIWKHYRRGDSLKIQINQLKTYEQELIIRK